MNDTWEWDGVEWMQVADTGPGPRASSGATYDSSRQRTILLGGWTYELRGGAFVPVELGETWEFAADAWTQVTTPGPGPLSAGPTIVYNGKVALLYNPKNGTTWTWDGKRWTERQDIGPGARNFVAMVYDSKRKRVVLFGGNDSAGVQSNDTWELIEQA